MKRQHICRADELRLKHNIPYEKALRHAHKRGISYAEAVKELVVAQNKTGAA